MATKRSDWRRYMTPLLATASPGRVSRPLVAMRQRAVTWCCLARAVLRLGHCLKLQTPRRGEAVVLGALPLAQSAPQEAGCPARRRCCSTAHTVERRQTHASCCLILSAVGLILSCLGPCSTSKWIPLHLLPIVLSASFLRCGRTMTFDSSSPPTPLNGPGRGYSGRS